MSSHLLLTFYIHAHKNVQGVRTALDDPPNRLCFLEGLMPFTHFLTPAQRGYVIALLDDGRDNFPEEVHIAQFTGSVLQAQFASQFMCSGFTLPI
jgi:hypothetical protein